MGDNSAIEWTDATWNPVTGCSKVSPGCAHCYAETLALTRLRGKPGYPGLPWTPENAEANVVLRPERLEQPLRWRRPRRIFVNSLSDLFHELVPERFLDTVFAVMALASQHTFQVLTKRPARMLEYLTAGGDPLDRIWCRADELATILRIPFPDDMPRWPLPNVWLGTSVENQRFADERIPLLLETPARVRFLSMEPLLGPVEFSDMSGRADYRARLGRPALTGIRWVIVGGESGPVHRPMDPAWVRSIRDQCVAADVPFLFKQWGGRTSKAGGRELDGRTWDQYP